MHSSSTAITHQNGRVPGVRGEVVADAVQQHGPRLGHAAGQHHHGRVGRAREVQAGDGLLVRRAGGGSGAQQNSESRGAGGSDLEGGGSDLEGGGSGRGKVGSSGGVGEEEGSVAK